MKTRRLGSLLMCGLLFASISHAGEIENLTNMLAEKGIITYGEAQQIITETREETRKSIAKGQSDTLPAWIQNLSMKGDLRLRFQNDWDPSSTGDKSRSRERLRLRTGFDTRIIDNVKAGFGLATGGETTSGGTDVYDKEPTSTNHTFSNGFGKPVVMIDYAFLEYTPFSWAKITGGKMKAGTQVWKTSDLLWDTDINPDGAALTLAKSFGPVNAFVTGSWLTFNETNKNNTNNPDALIAQPGASWTFLTNYTVKGAVAFENLYVSKKNTGYYGTPNFDYICVNPSVELAANDLVGPYGVTAFGDWVTNNDDAVKTDKNGQALGVRVGSAKLAKLGDWQMVYLSRRLEANSWLNKLGDSDAYGGAVNAQGYEVIGTVALSSALSFGIDFYNMDRIKGSNANSNKSLAQFDLVYKF